jgi:predicted nucleotidyltransferase
MEAELNILKVFFEYPEKEFYIREISRIIKVNHTTVRKYLNIFVKESYLTINKKGLYPVYKLNTNKKSLNLKLYYNLEKLRKSGIIEKLEKDYDYPTIITFGSYASATDNSSSDIDICLITDIKKEADYTAFEKELNRKLSFHIFSKQEWKRLKDKNPELLNNICNGITLSGKLEVV